MEFSFAILPEKKYSHHMVGVYLCYQGRRESQELYFPRDPAETCNNSINETASKKGVYCLLSAGMKADFKSLLPKASQRVFLSPYPLAQLAPVATNLRNLGWKLSSCETQWDADGDKMFFSVWKMGLYVQLLHLLFAGREKKKKKSDTIVGWNSLHWLTRTDSEASSCSSSWDPRQGSTAVCNMTLMSAKCVQRLWVMFPAQPNSPSPNQRWPPAVEKCWF